MPEDENNTQEEDAQQTPEEARTAPEEGSPEKSEQVPEVSEQDKALLQGEEGSAVAQQPDQSAEKPGAIEAGPEKEIGGTPEKEPESAEEDTTSGLSEEDRALLASAEKRDEAPSTPQEEEPPEEPPAAEQAAPAEEMDTCIFALRTTANREDQVLAFVSSHAARKKLPVYAVIAPHGMRGYIFLEAADRISAEQSAQGVPYAKGLLPSEVDYKEIEHMLEQVKKEVDIRKNDIVEIIAGPFKRENAKISRVDKQKEEVVVELLEAAVPIPITLKLDDVKVVRREDGEE